MSSPKASAKNSAWCAWAKAIAALTTSDLLASTSARKSATWEIVSGYIATFMVAAFAPAGAPLGFGKRPGSKAANCFCVGGLRAIKSTVGGSLQVYPVANKYVNKKTFRKSLTIPVVNGYCIRVRAGPFRQELPSSHDYPQLPKDLIIMPANTAIAPATKRLGYERADMLTATDLTELLDEALVRQQPPISECLAVAALAPAAIAALQRSAEWVETSKDYEVQQRIFKVQRLARELAEATQALKIETDRVAEHCPIPF
jgi:hypothetical protein